jgi:2-hydroxychromene-2-carboxylate isomerase
MPGSRGSRKRDHYLRDLLSWAEMMGVEMSPKAAELRKTDARPALRAAMVAAEMGRFREFHYPAYRARWSQGRDLSQPEVLAELLEKAGLDADSALARAEAEDVDATLQQRTQDAIDRGAFGVPTMFVGDKMFWGNDRFELVRFYIEKERSK